MSTRWVYYDFFRISSPTSGIFKDILEKEDKELQNKKINSHKVFDYYARIRELRIESKCWVADVERINVLDEAHIGDLQGARQTLATKADQGPLFDTIFLFDTVTETLVVQRNRSGLGISGMRKFLSVLLDDEDLDLEIVLDETTYRKFEKMSLIQEVEYNIAKPNESIFRDANRSGNGDLNLMKKLKGERMTVKIGSTKSDPLFLDAAKEKIKSILKHQNGDFETSTLRLKGMVDGDMDTIDLIKKRMVYPVKFSLGRGKKLTPPLLMDGSVTAYKKHAEALKRMFCL